MTYALADLAQDPLLAIGDDFPADRARVRRRHRRILAEPHHAHVVMTFAD